MAANQEFDELLNRIRAGDALAAEELVRRYESDIRMHVRIRLRIQDGRVRRMLDTMDITQSVLGSFFAGVAGGRFELETPEQLLALLATMARNKLLNHVRYQRGQRRDVQRLQSLGDAEHALQAHDESPSALVAGRELLKEFNDRLTVDERRIAEHRRLGRPWQEIAQEMGGTAEGLRKRLERAFARVAGELHLNEDLSINPAAESR